MPSVKYEQVPANNDSEEVTTKQSSKKSNDQCLERGALSLSLILLYFSLSIGLTFYQRWLLKVFIIHLLPIYTCHCKEPQTAGKCRCQGQMTVGIVRL